uniref:WRKY domain-containing protein n=1 Tax=Oryza meridionalis TaxID=40149 RepID=A0A0E0D733_9ORYZ
MGRCSILRRPLHSSPLRSLCSAMAEALVAVLRLAASAAATARPQSRSGRHGSCAARVPCPGPSPFRRGRLCARAAVAGPPEVDDDDAMTIDNLRRFFDVNVGKWNGAFYQFDAHGRVLQGISTRLSVSTYGEDDLISLLQSLYIKQASSQISFVDEEDSEEWVEYKIKETNMFTVDKYQQVGFFQEEKAFALRYQTAGMLETVLRAGVLGEDDTGEESPKNLKIPSRKPSIVCENCLYSLEGNGRVRAFHIMDPKGVLDMLIIFHEKQGSEVPLIYFSDDADITNNDRTAPLLGRWEGRSVTKRSGVYGATLSEADTVVLLEKDRNGQLILDNMSTKSGSSTTTTVHWTGSANNNLLQFDGGYEMTLLPGGMYMGYPTDIGKIVNDMDSFHLEFCWMESPGKRQRLVRTYDSAGLAVSSTYFFETKRLSSLKPHHLRRRVGDHGRTPDLSNANSVAGEGEGGDRFRRRRVAAATAGAIDRAKSPEEGDGFRWFWKYSAQAVGASQSNPNTSLSDPLSWSAAVVVIDREALPLHKQRKLRRAAAAAMADRRCGDGGDGMQQQPFTSPGQERVFDGGGGGVPGQVAAPYGSDFDQSSYMALLAAGAVGAGVGVQPTAEPWAVEEDVAAAPPGISLAPQFSMANYAPPPSYQHPATLVSPPLAAGLHPYPPYLHGVDAPPPQWPPRPAPPPSFSVLDLAAAAPPHEQRHSMQQLLLRAAAFGGGMHAAAAPAAAAAIEQPAKDGYNWRKYGQKQLKDAESPRSYYKCTRDGCPVKKIVERSSDGCIKEITYKGRHSHPRPVEPRRGGAAGSSSSAMAAGTDHNAGAAAVDEDDPSDDDDTLLHEDDDDGEEGHDRGVDGEIGQRVVRKPKIILQTRSEVDLLDDGYRWRKYGQKVVKGNPRPRSYYKCTADGCNVRKQIERASADPKCVLTTYTGRHNHDPPGRPAAAAANLQMPGPAAMSLAGGGTAHQQPSGGARQMKEET